jgi:hypothetical protein
MAAVNPESLPVLRPPVILLGMHRSGTSLIARLLDDLGLFQGAELQDDHESVYFMDVNDLLLKRVGAAWDNPAPVSGFLENADALRLTAACVRADLESKRLAGYLGLKRYVKYKSLRKLDSPWGWKDPRTVFTLPLWLRLFPEARLVYIVRNGVDVASSLRVREQRELARRVEELPAKARQLTSNSMLERAGFKGSARCLTLAGGFGLWEEYIAEAERALASVPNERMVINYERFLADPRDPTEGLAALAGFCGLDAGADAIAKALDRLNPGRANAFLADPELSAFYDEVKSSRWMRQYGYADLGAVVAE